MVRVQRLFSLAVPALLATSLAAQTTYWGMTSSGGANGIGSIYTITQSNVFTKKHDFFRYDGGTPKGDVVKATNGIYYGVTEFGGSGGSGVLWSFDPTTSQYAVLRNFNSATDGGRPIRGVTQAANGRLYGMCSEGGANNLGTIWEYNIGTVAFTKRFDFTATSGSAPRNRLVQIAGNLMYGVTQLGGANGRGTIFRVSATGTTFTKLYDFPALPGLTGMQPFSGLIAGTGTLMYGVTQVGGANGGGVIYSFNTTGNVYTSLYDFTQATGRFPLGEMVLSGGVLYGTTSQGGANNVGVIFSYNIGTDTYTNLHDFSSANGYSPFGRVVIGSDGRLYGTCSLGGNDNAGTMWAYNIGTDTYQLLYNFGDGDWAEPWGQVLEDPNGTFTCLTSAGGAGGSGALMKFNSGTLAATELVPFNYADGSTPKGRLLKATNGLFYGLTSAGGTNGAGVLFSYNAASSTFTHIIDFSNTLGTSPEGTLVESGGKLYGVCRTGGSLSRGTVFEFNPSTNQITKKVDLNATTGANPLKGFFKASNGKLYCLTSADAANGLGSLLEYTAGATSVTKLRDFTAADGSQPACDLMQASNGLCYGTMGAGGQFGFGTIFSFNPSGNTFTKLNDFFDLSTGSLPGGDLVEVGTGKLYGICREGADFFQGCIFSYTIGTNTIDIEYPFQATPTDEGDLGQSNLVLGTDGLLYGTCKEGGTLGFGTLFRFNPTTLAIVILQNFDGTTNGAYPTDGLARETVPASAVGLSAKLILEGPYNSGTGLMNTALRLLPSFPLTEPFTSAGFTLVGSGGETIQSSVLSVSGNNAIVDWVLIELRDKNNSATIQRTKPALLQSDGDVVDLDGTSAVTINMAPDNYFIAFRHRNHFGVMTAASVALTAAPFALDMTTGAVGTYGTNAQKVVGAARVCWEGNVQRDNVLKYTGASNDRDPILVRIGGTVPTATANGYYPEDANLDGVVKYTGSNNDRDPILVNIGGTVPTATILEQIP